MTTEEATAIASALCAEKGWSAPRYIDAGASGAVFEIEHPDHGRLALKIYDPVFFRGDNAEIEINRIVLQNDLRNHGNPHLIEILGVGEIPSCATWYQLMEFCPWPNLEKKASGTPEVCVEPLIQQLVSAVIFLQNNGLVHRDIKPANIAVSDDYSCLKLLDLGVLRRVDPPLGNGTDNDRAKRRFVATAQYSPHEYINRSGPEGSKGFEALNIYQVGAVLHDLIMKRPLFGEEAATGNRFILYEAIKTKPPIISNPALPPRLLALCRAALDKDPVRRMATVKLADFLEPSETPEAMRRRLAGRANSASKQPPLSLIVWRSQVADWIAAAASRERSTLKRHKLQEKAKAGALAWDVTFPDLGLTIHAELVSAADKGRLSLYFSVEHPAPMRSLVLEIFPDGANRSKGEIVTQLAEQLLYLLDVSAQPDDNKSETSPESTN